MRDVGVVVTKLHVIQYYSNQKKNDKEEGKFFPKAVPFFRPDEKIGVGEKKKGGGGELLSREFKISRCSKQSFRYGYAIHLSKVV